MTLATFNISPAFLLIYPESLNISRWRPKCFFLWSEEHISETICATLINFAHVLLAKTRYRNSDNCMPKSILLPLHSKAAVSTMYQQALYKHWEHGWVFPVSRWSLLTDISQLLDVGAEHGYILTEHQHRIQPRHSALPHSYCPMEEDLNGQAETEPQRAPRWLR